jgi:hypothetical protein
MILAASYLDFFPLAVALRLVIGRGCPGRGDIDHVDLAVKRIPEIVIHFRS